MLTNVPGGPLNPPATEPTRIPGGAAEEPRERFS